MKDWVTRHERAIAAEIDGVAGPNLRGAMERAGISPAARQAVLGELRDRPDIYRTPGGGLDVEAVTVTLMVNGR